uniref:Uncharacterized protein n=1 Tax=Meloidogyne enterolobii TaxID=390850 RepID=A0A6V7VYT4_MELEN|nr:unnamed protein product [Meloidogyne enterolobii]
MQKLITFFAFFLLLAFVILTEYSNADPIMEHAAHLNPDASQIWGML